MEVEFDLRHLAEAINTLPKTYGFLPDRWVANPALFKLRQQPKRHKQHLID